MYPCRHRASSKRLKTRKKLTTHSVVTVHVWGALRPAVNDAEKININATTVGELMRKLEEQYPRTLPFIEAGIAVSIDGTIYQDSWSQPLPSDAEIYLLPRIAGG